MRQRIVFTMLALASIALPATAQNHWLTSFKDSDGVDHIYFQSWESPFDLWQISPTYPVEALLRRKQPADRLAE